MVSASANEAEYNQTNVDHYSTANVLIVPTEKLYRPSPSNISRKHRDILGGAIRIPRRKVAKSKASHAPQSSFKTPQPQKHEHRLRTKSSAATPRQHQCMRRNFSDGDRPSPPDFLRSEQEKKMVRRTSDGQCSRSTGRNSGYLCIKKKTNRKCDPVSRYHSTQQLWQKDSFLRRRSGRRLKKFTPSPHHKHKSTAGLRLSASPDHTPHRSYRSRPSVNNYVVPTSKKRGRLRWEVRAQMMQQPEW